MSYLLLCMLKRVYTPRAQNFFVQDWNRIVWARLLHCHRLFFGIVQRNTRHRVCDGDGADVKDTAMTTTATVTTTKGWRIGRRTGKRNKEVAGAASGGGAATTTAAAAAAAGRQSRPTTTSGASLGQVEKRGSEHEVGRQLVGGGTYIVQCESTARSV
eukprot:scaffold61895_cov36-Phaeocystis_antarctica.AAC.2